MLMFFLPLPLLLFTLGRRGVARKLCWALTVVTSLFGAMVGAAAISPPPDTPVEVVAAGAVVDAPVATTVAPEPTATPGTAVPDTTPSTTMPPSTVPLTTAPLVTVPPATAPPVTAPPTTAKPACQTGDGVKDTRNRCLFPGRPGSQKNDHEAVVGQEVRISGFTAIVEDIAIDGAGGGSNALVTIRLENRDDSQQDYWGLDWGIQTPSGQLKGARIINMRSDDLDYGVLIPGGSVVGTLVFNLDDGSGSYYMLFSPDHDGSGRGIWKIDY